MNLYGKNYKLVWEDHFDGNTLSPLWSVKHYCNDGHNGHKAWRTPQNVTLENSNLVIRGKIEENGDFTSGMIKTDFSFCYKYGYCEIRAKLPKSGKGRWPGFWMCDPGWPGGAGMEIDVLEMFGDDEYIACNIHGWWCDHFKNTEEHHLNYLDGQNYPKTKHLTNGARFSDDYHTIGFEWTPEIIQFLVDGEPYCSIMINNPVFATFRNKPLYIILSMAYGLPFLDCPEDDGTAAEYFIDYIRLYQNEDGKLFKRSNGDTPFIEIKSMEEL